MGFQLAGSLNKNCGEKESRVPRSVYLSRDDRDAETWDRTIIGIITCRRAVIRETMFSPEIKHKVL